MNEIVSAVEKGILFSGYILCSGEISKAFDMATKMAKAAKTTPYIIEQPTMEKIRNLQSSLYEDVTIGHGKIAIIYSDEISDRCQNAMLKTIEESKGNISIIFITTNISVLLPTIISRCIVYYPKKDREDEILKEIGSENMLFCRYSQNSINKAKELMADDEFKESRKEAIIILNVLLGGSGQSVKKENSHKIASYLNFFYLFFADVLTKKSYWFFDESDMVEDNIKIFTTAQIIGIINIVQTGIERIKSNANPMLCFDNVALGILEVVNECCNRG